MMKNTKHIILLGTATLAAAFLVLLSSHSTVHAATAESISVYRLYNSSTGEHLYSTNSNEVETLTGEGWSYENVVFDAPSSGTAVDRLYNSATGQHVYSADPHEQKVLSGEGWKNEGEVFYVEATQLNPTDIGITRLYNSASGQHLFSSDPNEISTLTAQGWQNEGTIGYAAPASNSDSSSNSSSDNSLFSTESDPNATLSQTQQEMLLDASPLDILYDSLNPSVYSYKVYASHDFYDYNILASFKNHNLAFMTQGFYGYSNSQQFQHFNYLQTQINDAQSLMAGFASALKGKTTDFQKVEAIVDYVSKTLHYDVTYGGTTDRVDDLYYQNISIYNNNGYPEFPTDDYSDALIGFQNKYGDCHEYAQIAQLGFLYAGIPAKSASSQTHQWNEVQINGQWYLSDSTWVRNATTDPLNPVWVAMGAIGLANADKTLDAEHVQDHNVTVNGVTLANTTYLLQ